MVFLLLQRMNLTAVKGVDGVMERHVQDSLAIVTPIRSSYVPHCSASCGNISLVDVGSGAGLPGLILAIACPGDEFLTTREVCGFCNMLSYKP